MSIRANVEELNGMILQGQVLEAFEKFYSDDVEMVEVDGSVRSGKEENRAFEESFVNNLVDFRSAEVKNVAVDEDSGTAFVEWFMDYTHKEWGDRTYHQVSVQTWDGNQIKSEKFYSS